MGSIISGTSGSLSNYWIATANGIRNGTPYTPVFRLTGLYTGVRESTTGAGGSGINLNYNIALSPTNSGNFLAYSRSGSIPSQEGYWNLHGNNTDGSVRYNGGNIQMWWADGSVQNVAAVPTAGVLGRINVNGVESLWLNQTNLATYTNGIVNNSQWDAQFAEGTSSSTLSTNVTIWAAGYCGGYTSLQFSNIESIVSLYGVDKTNYAAIKYP